jgi:60 kDa SS-A/Ro ribonucleoprotein
MARVNVSTKLQGIHNAAVAPLTHEGARAAVIGPVDQLRRSVMACMLWEDTFYEDGISIATRIHNEVAAVLKLEDGADTVANIAVEARTRMKLRHAPLWLAVALIRANTPETRAVVSGVLAHVIQRADEPGELIAMFWKACGKRQMLPHQMKLGIEAALRKFDRYKVSKYANRPGQIQLRDALFLSKAKPLGEEQTALWKQLADQQLTAPDTWESQLSAGADKKAVFTTMLQEKTLLPMALLRNLRNMEQSGVDTKLVRQSILDMDTTRVLPFRFITAANVAPKFEPELEQALFKCIANTPKWGGKTAICIDVSGSMTATLSAKSVVTRKDAASALGMILRELCDEVQVFVFANFAQKCKPRRGFALRDETRAYQIGVGTNMGMAVRQANADGYDRIIVVSDEQSNSDLGLPLPDATGYMINVGSNRNGVGYGKWMHIDGFSEATVQYIGQLEGKATAQSVEQEDESVESE